MLRARQGRSKRTSPGGAPSTKDSTVDRLDMVVSYPRIVIVFRFGGDGEIGDSFAARVALLTWGSSRCFVA